MKLIARVDGVIGETSAKKYWYHTDHLGSVKAVTNNLGVPVWKADYFAFGQQYGKEKLDETFEEDDIGFTGKGFDAEIGLYYFNARWYDADTGRFISEDPVADPNNPNLYSYGRNNPLRFIDPTGLVGEDGYPGQNPGVDGWGYGELSNQNYNNNNVYCGNNGNNDYYDSREFEQYFKPPTYRCFGSYNDEYGRQIWVWGWYGGYEREGEELKTKVIRFFELQTLARILRNNLILREDGGLETNESINQVYKKLIEISSEMKTLRIQIGNLGGVFEQMSSDYILPIFGTVTSVFGKRTPPTYIDENGVLQQGTSEHKGWDISAAQGTDVVTIGDGVVIYAQKVNNKNGNVVIVDHGKGIYSYYFHVQNMTVKEGDTVIQGSKVAEVGNIGTGPHLHFAMSSGGEKFNGYFNPINSVPALAGLPVKTTAVNVVNGVYSNH